MNYIKIIIQRFGIDFHIGVTLIARLWIIVAGAILLLLIPVYLTEPEQGYYFTFSSLIATQIFFELGFNYVVIQMVGHEMANLTYDNKKGFSGRSENINRILCLIGMLKKWYSIISIVFFIMVSYGGYYFFSKNGNLPLSDWTAAWFAIVAFTSINLFISPYLAVLEGIGLVGNVSRLKLFQSIIGYSILFVLLLLQKGLFSIPVLSGSMAICSFIWLFYTHRHIILTKPSDANDANYEKISWKKDIFPFQWRIALSWLSGYFIFQLFNPIIFANQGEIEAGRIGLTLTMFSTILSLSMSWVTAKSPVMARLIAERKFKDLDRLFKSVIIKSGIANLIILTTFVLLVILVREYGFSISKRLADTEIILLLLIVSVANHFIFSAATYMRAHKREPLLWNSLVTGVLIAITILILCKISVLATMIGYSFVIVLITLPWTIYIFKEFKKNYYDVTKKNK
ncbi:hypothetical protein [Xenorhabdus littoralis]|uniref:hypothetical protein n=1 Tax=Xenorhabdus littoralis TaxID=2582835 RepID=UPI0029E80A87|nr:hypothetical protein [Xenorhabdus sp. psl]MDX7991996.1 hypothetical protein [Xenorhabdus sp. psl]